MAKPNKKIIRESNFAPMPKSKDIIVREMIQSQDRLWEISDGSTAEPGGWYTTKQDRLALLEELSDNGFVKARSHFSGNLIDIPPEQVIYFKKAEDPGTICGTLLITADSTNDVEETSKHNNTYLKYPHVIPGSIYKVQNNVKDTTPTWERKRKGKKITIRGQVRCKIICQEPGCSNERDIKIQDAFQVKKCETCRDRKKKKSLNKFLKNKKDKK